MDDRSALRLQLEWGADESLDERPLDRRIVRQPPAPPMARPPQPGVAAQAPPPAQAPAQSQAQAQAQAQALAAAADSPAALRAALHAFDGCALRTTAANTVFAAGDPASRLILLADVPGAAEDRAGLPFAGPGAAFLDRMLASAGLDRSAWYATSVLPWRPPGDRKPSEAELQACLPFLLRHLALLQPHRVIMFGATAARSLLSPTTGRRARRGWQDLALPGLPGPVPALALATLAQIQGTPGIKRDTWAELLRLRRTLDEITAS